MHDEEYDDKTVFVYQGPQTVKEGLSALSNSEVSGTGGSILSLNPLEGLEELRRINLDYPIKDYREISDDAVDKLVSGIPSEKREKCYDLIEDYLGEKITVENEHPLNRGETRQFDSSLLTVYLTLPGQGTVLEDSMYHKYSSHPAQELRGANNWADSFSDLEAALETDGFNREHYKWDTNHWITAFTNDVSPETLEEVEEILAEGE